MIWLQNRNELTNRSHGLSFMAALRGIFLESQNFVNVILGISSFLKRHTVQSLFFAKISFSKRQTWSIRALNSLVSFQRYQPPLLMSLRPFSLNNDDNISSFFHHSIRSRSNDPYLTLLSGLIWANTKEAFYGTMML